MEPGIAERQNLEAFPTCPRIVLKSLRIPICPQTVLQDRSAIQATVKRGTRHYSESQLNCRAHWPAPSRAPLATAVSYPTRQGRCSYGLALGNSESSSLFLWSEVVASPFLCCLTSPSQYSCQVGILIIPIL